MERAKLVAEFDEEMLNIYRLALSEAGYKATRFLTMVNEEGGLATAKRLIQSSQVSEGYTALWELKRLDLTVEATILADKKWEPLFTSAELSTCALRLNEYGFSR